MFPQNGNTSVPLATVNEDADKVLEVLLSDGRAYNLQALKFETGLSGPCVTAATKYLATNNMADCSDGYWQAIV